MMDFIRRLLGLQEPDAEQDDRVKEEDASLDEASSQVKTAPLEYDPAITPTDLPPYDASGGAASKKKDLQTRPLEAPQEYASKSRRIRYGSATDTGLSRMNNQDSAMTLMTNVDSSGKIPPLGLFVVADGMGGHTDGEIASAVAVQTLSRFVIDDVIRPILNGSHRNAKQATIPEVLQEAMEAANQEVQAQVPSGGTTATVVVIQGSFAYFSHVGDSRAYLITSSGQIEQITRDHSLVRRLMELGQITPDEAETHPQKNVLYRALGQNASLESDAATRRLPPGSRLLLCSDGLWGEVEEDEILRILNASPDPQEACERLVEAANENGGKDNITVVMIQMPD